ncbi:hypothetical protein DZF96_18040, partial [Clavibacter michiganensis]
MRTRSPDRCGLLGEGVVEGTAVELRSRVEPETKERTERRDARLHRDRTDAPPGGGALQPRGGAPVQARGGTAGSSGSTVPSVPS